MKRRTLSVLFVCTGNICRSPTAEAVARKIAEDRGKAIVFDSAGTGDWHDGETPDSRAVKAAAARGYDLSGITARAVTEDDFTAHDHIVALDQSHVKWLIARRAALRLPEKRISRLMDWSIGLANRDVPDPFYGEDKDFEAALDLIEKGCSGLVARV
ncbi:MAG: low molecular weight protein-tyrosine-phosphatase [Oceanicaulis sp.]